MTDQVIYHKGRTDLVVIDPYNDFISEGGKVWERLRDVAEANKCVPHMSQVLDAARSAGIRIFLCASSPVSAGRLRELDVYCADPKGGMVT